MTICDVCGKSVALHLFFGGKKFCLRCDEAGRLSAAIAAHRAGRMELVEPCAAQEAAKEADPYGTRVICRKGDPITKRKHSTHKERSAAREKRVSKRKH